MRAHFTAIHPIHLTHALLDEGVAGFGQYRGAAAGLDDFDRVPGQARIVHHFAAGLAAQQNRRQQADDVVPLDETAPLIEQKTAVEVPVPGDTEIRPGLADRLHRGLAVLLQHGIRDPVRKMPVRLMMNFDELERQMRFELVDDESGAAVAGIHHNFERFQRRQVHIGQEVAHIGFGGIDAMPHTQARRGGEPAELGKPADVGQTIVAADRL